MKEILILKEKVRDKGKFLKEGIFPKNEKFRKSEQIFLKQNAEN